MQLLDVFMEDPITMCICVHFELIRFVQRESSSASDGKTKCVNTI